VHKGGDSPGWLDGGKIDCKEVLTHMVNNCFPVK
jgi:hypothetical protein